VKITKSETDELRNYGYSIQNKGFILVENKSDYHNALIPIESAIAFWTSIKDVGNEANLRKYKGMILGNLHRFKEGKLEIRRAIELFKKINFDPGIAVSQYDMSQVFDLENNLDSALIYQKQATAFWFNRKDTNRIIANNTQMIHLYRRLKKYAKAIEIQKINETLLKAEEHWNPTINFYYVSYILFEETENKDKADSFKNLYHNKLEALRNEGINSKSFYDRSSK
jgi:tetratricopeptide (TPR) repeat protein